MTAQPKVSAVKRENFGAGPTLSALAQNKFRKKATVTGWTWLTADIR